MMYKKFSSVLLKGQYINLFLFALIISSCSAPKNVAYFQDITDTANVPVMVQAHKYVEPKIKVDDILTVRITSLNEPEITSLGDGESSKKEGGTAAESPAYLVGTDGTIDVPLVGNLKVSGLTTSEVKNLIYQRAKKYLIEPIVNVHFANFRFTVLGDVMRPGTYTLKNEKINILDAIGMAGDILLTGKRDQILLIRENEDGKIFVKLNIQSTDMIKSPYFYLHPGDIIYIEPLDVKSTMATRDVTKDRYIAYLFSGITLTVTLANFVLNANRR